MTRYLMLLKFTDQGMAAVKDSPKRAKVFEKAAAKAGAKIEAQLWTVGRYDGAVLLAAPDEAAASRLALDLGRLGNVRTELLRAYDAGEFEEIVSRLK